MRRAFPQKAHCGGGDLKACVSLSRSGSRKQSDGAGAQAVHEGMSSKTGEVQRFLSRKGLSSRT